MKRFSFGKVEHLKSRKVIGQLFSDGKTCHVYPVRALYQTNDDDSMNVQCAFTVPKRSFKKAVLRNRIKRLMRESYRLQKNTLIDELQSLNISIIFIYTGKSELSYAQISKAMSGVLKRLVMELNPKDEK